MQNSSTQLPTIVTKILNESEDEQVKTQVFICITFSLQAQFGENLSHFESRKH
jgi:hypothetical protein